jgi:sporulation protein YhbH
MSLFKKHKTVADRSASDRRRHKHKIEKAIKEGIHNIVAEESIIGKDGKKKIKIPVRGIKEYRFVYDQGNNSKRVGSAPGKDIKKGQKIKDGKKQGQGQGPGKKPGKPGDQEGEEFYDVEISLDELAHYLFDDLNLPDLEKKSFQNIMSEKWKRKGYRSEGIRPRLSKKETLKNKIRRKKKAIKSGTFDPDGEERFPFHKDDLKYKHITKTYKNITNAAIFFVMDVSGSMTTQRKFIARSFFFLLYHFIRYRYDSVDIIFISHTTTAQEVSEEQFFSRGSSGGTMISTGPEKCLEIIEKRYPPESWNIYNFHCSDGDNWDSDNNKALELSTKLKQLCQMSAYIQIKGENEGYWNSEPMADIYRKIEDDKFKVAEITKKEDIWKEFKRIMGGRIE